MSQDKSETDRTDATTAGTEPHPPVTGPQPPSTTSQSEIVRVERPSRDGAVERVPHMERVRWQLAQYLVWLLIAVIMLVFALIGTSRWTKVPLDDVRSIFELMFTALVALVGSAVGFYYGSSDGRR